VPDLNTLRVAIDALTALGDDPSAELTQRQRDTINRLAVRLTGWTRGELPKPRAGLLTRGQFAKLAGVSPNTLVKWHASGALIPVEVDAVSGFRYYATAQLAAVKSARQRKPRAK
jgi:hypothetical protein